MPEHCFWCLKDVGLQQNNSLSRVTEGTGPVMSGNLRNVRKVPNPADKAGR
jgi:hypothetical protein